MQYMARTAIEAKGNTLIPQTLFPRRTDIRPPWAQFQRFQRALYVITVCLKGAVCVRVWLTLGTEITTANQESVSSPTQTTLISTITSPVR